MSVVLSPNDMVYVTLNKNVPGKEDVPMVIGWDSREYELKVGQQTVAPLEAVINWFGDPRSTDNVQLVRIGGPESTEKLMVPDRNFEVKRLRQRYAIMSGFDDGFVDFDGKSLVPDVTIKTLSGDEVIPVTADPKGEQIIQATQTIAQATDANSMIAHMQEQIRVMQEQLARAGQTAPTSLSSLPDDVDTGKPPPIVSTVPNVPDPNKVDEEVDSDSPPVESTDPALIPIAEFLDQLPTDE